MGDKSPKATHKSRGAEKSKGGRRKAEEQGRQRQANSEG
jgi:hypothetical protein